MSDFIRFVGSAVVALILMSIPALSVASFALEWHAFLKALLCAAMISEGMLITRLIYERSDE